MIETEKTLPCEAEPELFFPPGEEKSDPSRMQQYAINAAKSICNQCEVRVQCLDKAIEDGEPYGIWGGMTSYERNAIIRKAGRAAMLLRNTA